MVAEVTRSHQSFNSNPSTQSWLSGAKATLAQKTPARKSFPKPEYHYTKIILLNRGSVSERCFRRATKASLGKQRLITYATVSILSRVAVLASFRGVPPPYWVTTSRL